MSQTRYIVAPYLGSPNAATVDSMESAMRQTKAVAQKFGQNRARMAIARASTRFALFTVETPVGTYHAETTSEAWHAREVLSMFAKGQTLRVRYGRRVVTTEERERIRERETMLELAVADIRGALSSPEAMADALSRVRAAARPGADLHKRWIERVEQAAKEAVRVGVNPKVAELMDQIVEHMKGE